MNQQKKNSPETFTILSHRGPDFNTSITLFRRRPDNAKNRPETAIHGAASGRFYRFYLKFYSITSSTGQWSDPITSVWICALTSRFSRLFEVQK